MRIHLLVLPNHPTCKIISALQLVIIMIVVDALVHAWNHDLVRFILIHAMNQIRNLHFYVKKSPFFRTSNRNRRVVRRIQLHDPIALRQLLRLTAPSLAHRINPVFDLAVHVEVVGVIRGRDEENERLLRHEPHVQVQERVRLHVRDAHRQPALRRAERNRFGDQSLQQHLVYTQNGETGKLRGCRGN